MSQYQITLILDDTIPAQATLLGEIQSNLTSIASVLPPSGALNIQVVKLK